MNSLTAYCSECRYGQVNTGRIIPNDVRAVFCLRLESIRDKAVVEILEPMLVQLAASQQCPHFDPGCALPDSYRSLDLPIS